MKVTIVHTIEEREEADAVLSALRPLLAWGKSAKATVMPRFYISIWQLKSRESLAIPEKILDHAAILW